MNCWTRNKDGSYSVTGNGPMRPIAVEGDTRALARQNWMFEFGRQYEEAERATNLSTQWEEMSEGHRDKKMFDARMLARDYRGRE